MPELYPAFSNDNTVQILARVCPKNRSVIHVVFLHQRSSFTLRTRQVHVRRSNIIPVGHRILGHLHMQVLGSRSFTACLQGLLLHVQRHFSSSNWKRFVHFDSMFVGSHLHWHFTGSQRKLLGQGIVRGLHWQLHCSLEYCCVLLSQSVGLTLHPQEHVVWLVTRTAVNSSEIFFSSVSEDDQPTLLTTRFRSSLSAKENKRTILIIRLNSRLWFYQRQIKVS